MEDDRTIPQGSYFFSSDMARSNDEPEFSNISKQLLKPQHVEKVAMTQPSITLPIP